MAAMAASTCFIAPVASVNRSCAPRSTRSHKHAIGCACASCAPTRAGAVRMGARSQMHSAGCCCASCSPMAGKPAARTFGIKPKAMRASKMVTVCAAKGYGGVTPAAYPKFFKELDESFPGAMPYEEYLVASQTLLGRKGYNGENSLALVSMCRDEITRPFVDGVDQLWGHSFSIASLAGMVMCGKTGFAAGLSHAPQEDLGEDGLEKYVFLVGPHIAISGDGEVGKVKRLGRGPLSGACGAIMAFQGELTGGTLTTQGDEVDLELNLMKQRMLSMLKFGGSVPSLVDLTKAAHDRILIDTKTTASYAVNPAISTSSFLSGVLVHGPEYTHYFWPASFEVLSPTGITDMSEELAEIDESTYAKEMGSYVTARNAMNAVKMLLQSVRASHK